MRLVTCAHGKDHKVKEHMLSFVQDGKLWSLPIQICVDPDCLEARGATHVEHKVQTS